VKGGPGWPGGRVLAWRPLPTGISPRRGEAASLLDAPTHGPGPADRLVLLCSTYDFTSGTTAGRSDQRAGPT
jgi:hypothetical protein